MTIPETVIPQKSFFASISITNARSKNTTTTSAITEIIIKKIFKATLFFTIIFIFWGKSVIIAQPPPASANNPPSPQTDKAGATSRQQASHRSGPADYSLWAGQTIFDQQDIRYLPIGAHIGSVLGYWHNISIVANEDRAGLAVGEDLFVNRHGSSQIWQNWWLNGGLINDPSRPGQALIDLPNSMWRQFRINSWAAARHQQEGYHFLTPLQIQDTTLNLGYQKHLGGATWMPSETLDREPAMDWGAPEQGKKFRPSFVGQGSLPFWWGQKNYLSFEHQQLRKWHPANQSEEPIQKTTLLWQGNSGSDPWSKRPSHIALAWQRLAREQVGAAWGASDNLMSLARYTYLLQYFAGERRHQGSGYTVTLGGKWLRQYFNDDEIVRSLFAEVHNAPLQKEKKTYAHFVDINMRQELPQGALLDLPRHHSFRWGAHLRWEHINRQRQMPQDWLARSYQGMSVDVTLFDGGADTTHNLWHGRPYLAYTWKMNTKWRLQAQAGLALEGATGGGQWLVGRAGPSVGLQTKWQGRVQFTAALLHEPLPITLQEAAFLHPEGLAGARYSWLDSNNDLIYQKGEEGEILNRTGSPYHNKAHDLKMPVKEEIDMGVRIPLGRVWSLVVQGSIRIYRQLLTVRYDPDFDANFEKISTSQNMEEGYLYDRQPGTYGEELYQLQNNPHDSYYLDLELELIKKKFSSGWFLNMSISAHYAEGYPITGNSAHYNDIGFIHESSADPNNRIANYARTDYDRGYVANFVFGAFLIDGLSWSNTLRYRDGQNFGRFIIAEGLNQGTFPVEVHTRGTPPIGRPRYTYAFTWDVRLMYELSFSDYQGAIKLDIYNIVNSRTEVYEYIINDERLREPLATLPARSLALWLEFKF